MKTIYMRNPWAFLAILLAVMGAIIGFAIAGLASDPVAALCGGASVWVFSWIKWSKS